MIYYACLIYLVHFIGVDNAVYVRFLTDRTRNFTMFHIRNVGTKENNFYFLEVGTRQRMFHSTQVQSII